MTTYDGIRQPTASLVATRHGAADDLRLTALYKAGRKSSMVGDKSASACPVTPDDLRICRSVFTLRPFTEDAQQCPHLTQTNFASA